MDSPCALNLITEGRPSRRSVTVNTVGDLFTYDPRTTDSSLVGFTGRLPFRYRLIHLNSAGNVITTGNWVSYPIVIDGIATTSGLSLSGYSLGTGQVLRLSTALPPIHVFRLRLLAIEPARPFASNSTSKATMANVTRYVEFSSAVTLLPMIHALVIHPFSEKWAQSN